MRINQTGNNQAREADVGRVRVTRAPHSKQSQATRAAEGRNAKGSSGPVSAEISTRAKEFAKAKAIAHDTPDVREEKIAALKERIDGGRYHVDADSVADRMVNEHLKMHGLG